MKRDPVQTAITLMKRSPGDFFCVSVKNPARSSPGNWKDHFFKRNELHKIPEFVRKQRGKDVYMCPQGFSKPKRDKSYAQAPFLSFADLDECKVNEIPIKPTILIESSPGRYVGYWYTDGPVPEELNRRLTYFVGADPSGWDWSQVLRMPGTKNHKYDNKPTVKIVWSDGPRYEVSRLDKMVPPLQTEEGREKGGDAQDIYDEYEKFMSRELRKELTNPRVQQGKRSEVLWKMIHECVELGMTKEETFTLLWDNEWNKFHDRRGGEGMLERQIDKAVGEHVGGSKKIPANRKTRRKVKSKKGTKESFFNLVPMSDVEAENPDWLVPGMIARGETTIIEGDPGVGKSYFLMWLCIHFCDGRYVPWDTRKGRPKPMKVAYFDTENSMGVVTKSRLVDNGLKNFDNYYQIQDSFSLQDEDAVEAIEEELIKRQGIDVLIIDPVTPYLGGADSNNAKEVRQTLDEINSLAHEYGVAVVIVRHLNKSKNTKALYAGGGSIGFSGLARVVATVGWHPEEAGVRVVACTKNNLSMPFGSMGYTIEPLPDLVGRTNRSSLEFIGHMDFTSDEIINTENVKEDNSTVIAADLIRERMNSEGDEINYHSLLKAADARSITERSVKKAAAELGLKKVSRGRGKTRQTLLVPERDKASKRSE